MQVFNYKKQKDFSKKKRFGVLDCPNNNYVPWKEKTELSFKDVLNIKFKKFIRPKLSTYVAIYTKLAKKSIDEKVFKDILLIGLNVRDKFGNFIYNVDIDDNGQHDATPNYVINFSKYSKEAVCDYARAEGVNIPIPPSKVKDFQIYMEILCALLTKLIFKNSMDIRKKTDNISLGTSILGKNYGGLNSYLAISYDLITKLRSYSDNHCYKKIIAIILIKNFIKYNNIKYFKIVNFMNWLLMKDTFCIEFRTIRLILDVLEITEIKDLKKFMNFFSLNENEREIEKLLPILRKVLTKDNHTESYFYQYAGMIDSYFLINLRYQNYPKTSSLMIGFLDGCRSVYSPINLTSFSSNQLLIQYYKKGQEKAKYLNRCSMTKIY